MGNVHTFVHTLGVGSFSGGVWGHLTRHQSHITLITKFPMQKTVVIMQTIQENINMENEQIQEIQEALEEADKKDFTTQAEMNTFWAHWVYILKKNT